MATLRPISFRRPLLAVHRAHFWGVRGSFAKPEQVAAHVHDELLERFGCDPRTCSRLRMHVRVCVYVRVCVRACVCARVRARARVHVCMCMRERMGESKREGRERGRSVCVRARARANKPRKHRAVALSHDEAAVLGPEAQRDLACPLRRLVFI